MSTITYCLLNWKRPQQLLEVVDALACQSVRPGIFVWNNSPDGFFHPAVDWQIDSSRNLKCLPRWWMAARADTEFVASLDDDILPADDNVVKDLLASIMEQPADRVVGPVGAIFNRADAYQSHLQVDSTPVDCEVDLIKGRCMALHKSALISRISTADLFDEEEDDLMLCGSLAAGRPKYHLVPAILRNRFRELPQGRESLCHRDDHYLKRQSARVKWFGY